MTFFKFFCHTKDELPITILFEEELYIIFATNVNWRVDKLFLFLFLL